MTKDEEQAKLDFAHERDSFTSPTIDDLDFDNDNLYFWDCWNAEYCCKYRKREVKRHSCLRGAEFGSRCNREEKESVRAEALKKGFIFPNA